MTNGFSHPYHLKKSTLFFRDIRSNFSFLCQLYGLIYILDQSPTSYHAFYDFNQAGVIRMIALFCIECASWTGFFSHICYACQMTRATSINDNLINKRGTFDDSQVSTTKADIIVGQKSGPALAGQATTALNVET